MTFSSTFNDDLVHMGTRFISTSHDYIRNSIKRKKKKLCSHTNTHYRFNFAHMHVHMKHKLIGLILINEYISNWACSDNIWCIIRHIIPTAGDELLLCRPRRHTHSQNNTFIPHFFYPLALNHVHSCLHMMGFQFSPSRFLCLLSLTLILIRFYP